MALGRHTVFGNPHLTSAQPASGESDLRDTVVTPRPSLVQLVSATAAVELPRLPDAEAERVAMAPPLPTSPTASSAHRPPAAVHAASALPSAVRSVSTPPTANSPWGGAPVARAVTVISPITEHGSIVAAPAGAPPPAWGADVTIIRAPIAESPARPRLGVSTQDQPVATRSLASTVLHAELEMDAPLAPPAPAQAAPTAPVHTAPGQPPPGMRPPPAPASGRGRALRLVLATLAVLVIASSVAFRTRAHVRLLSLLRPHGSPQTSGQTETATAETATADVATGTLDTAAGADTTGTLDSATGTLDSATGTLGAATGATGDLDSSGGSEVESDTTADEAAAIGETAADATAETAAVVPEPAVPTTAETTDAERSRSRRGRAVVTLSEERRAIDLVASGRIPEARAAFEALAAAHPDDPSLARIASILGAAGAACTGACR